MQRLLTSTRANITVMAMGFLGVTALITGGVVDYMSLVGQQKSLQEAADSMAVAAAREMIIANVTPERVQEVASAFAAANYSGTNVTASARLVEDAKAVAVTLASDPKTFFPGPIGLNAKRMAASATAEISGGGNVCMIGLDPSANATVLMSNSARLTARGCAVYSNSTSVRSLTIRNAARIHADLVCVAGGVDGVKSTITPEPVEDCPAISDPLRDRPPPVAADAPCDYKMTMIPKGKPRTLDPGVYCGGIVVSGGNVTLNPGVYVMKDGPLAVPYGRLAGEHVGFFLDGPKSWLNFGVASDISLSAPKTGAMAGMLFFERSGAPTMLPHRITSDNAHRLVGTIYLPNSKLLVDANKPVADLSEWTIIIARAFELKDGPDLVRRTDYEASPIPVPEGVGPNSASTITLVR